MLTYTEYLHANGMSSKIIKHYILSASVMEDCYNIDHEALSHSCVVRLLRSIDMNTMFAPTPQGGFDARTVYFLSISYDNLRDPLLFRAIFLTAYYGFLRMSSISPDSASRFDPLTHLLQKIYSLEITS